jgi:hypothetical protein
VALEADGEEERFGEYGRFGARGHVLASLC